MVRIGQDELQSVISQLDQALYNHEQWFKSLNRTLTCKLLCDTRDLEQDAYRKCLFGQWYYNYAPFKLREHPSFIAIEGEHRRMHEIASILLSSSSSGAQITPLDYDEIVNVVERMRLQIHTLKRELEDALYNCDPLTGARSRLGMLTKLREQQELVKRQMHECCISIMDLDHFKAINDTYGHLTGDCVLSALVRQMTDHLRPYDSLFRYGGEEFLICLMNAGMETGHSVVERLRQEISDRPFDCPGQGPVYVTASFGISLLDPSVPIEQSIDYADKALFMAKSAGRNCTRIWKAA